MTRANLLYKNLTYDDDDGGLRSKAVAALLLHHFLLPRQNSWSRPHFEKCLKAACAMQKLMWPELDCSFGGFSVGEEGAQLSADPTWREDG